MLTGFKNNPYHKMIEVTFDKPICRVRSQMTITNSVIDNTEKTFIRLGEGSLVDLVEQLPSNLPTNAKSSIAGLVDDDSEKDGTYLNWLKRNGIRYIRIMTSVAV